MKQTVGPSTYLFFPGLICVNWQKQYINIMCYRVQPANIFKQQGMLIYYYPTKHRYMKDGCSLKYHVSGLAEKVFKVRSQRSRSYVYKCVWILQSRRHTCRRRGLEAHLFLNLTLTQCACLQAEHSGLSYRKITIIYNRATHFFSSASHNFYETPPTPKNAVFFHWLQQR